MKTPKDARKQEQKRANLSNITIKDQKQQIPQMKQDKTNIIFTELSAIKQYHSQNQMLQYFDGVQPSKKHKKQSQVQQISNQQIKTQKQERQKALWALLYIQKILQVQQNKMKTYSNLPKYLLQSKYEQLGIRQQKSVEAEKYMRGFFDVFQRENGPKLNKTVFNQKRFNAFDSGEKITFFPTIFTKIIFQYILRKDQQTNISDLRGIGKSFSIMLYCELSQLIIKQKLLNANIPKCLDIRIKKAFYWTIKQSQITTQSDALSILKDLFQTIINQCDIQFRLKYKKDIDYFENQIQKSIQDCKKQQSNKSLQQQYTNLVFKNARKFNNCLNNFGQICRQIHTFYLYYNNISTILFIDQINTIASCFRETENALYRKKSLADFSFEQKVIHLNGRVNQNIRRSLSNIDDHIIHLSPIEIQKHFYKQRFQKTYDEYDLKIQLGTRHCRMFYRTLHFENIFQKEVYQETIKQFIIFEFWRMYPKDIKKKQNIEQGQIICNQLRRQLQNRKWALSLQPLLINRYLQQTLQSCVAQNISQQMKAIFNQMQQLTIQTVANQLGESIKQKIQELKKQKNNRKVYQIQKQISVYGFLAHRVQCKLRSNQSQSQCNSLFKINLSAYSFLDDYKLKIQQVKRIICKEYFFIKKVYNQNGYNPQYILISYLTNNILQKVLHKYFSSFNHLNIYNDPLFALQVTKQRRASKGHFYEVKAMTEFQRSDQVFIQSKKYKKQYIIKKQQIKSFPSFRKYKDPIKNSQSYSFQKLKPIIKNNNLKDEEYYFCFPVQIQQQNNQNQPKQMQFDESSAATDFILIKKNATKFNNILQINFFQVTIQQDYQQKIRKFATLLTQMKQMKLEYLNLQELFQIKERIEISFYLITPEIKNKLITQQDI